MKTMKKALSWLLAVVLVLSPMAAFATVDSGDGTTPPETPTNIVAGKDYDVKDPDAYLSNGDTLLGNLTDGKLPTADPNGSTTNEWFGFVKGNHDGLLTVTESNVVDGIGTVIFELGQTYTLTELKAYLFPGGGVPKPEYIAVYTAGEDGEYGEAIKATVTLADWSGANWFTMSLEEAAPANYVKVEFKIPDSKQIVTIGEIEIYGVEGVVEDDTSSEDTPSEDVSDDTPSEDVSDDTPSEDVSDDTPSEDVSDDTPSEDVSDDTSDDTSSEPEPPSEPDPEEPETPADPFNIALNKTYEATVTNQAGGTLQANLTDGVAEKTAPDMGTNLWFAFTQSQLGPIINTTNGVGTVVIDLGVIDEVDTIKIHMYRSWSATYPAPASVKAYLSTDGETYGEAIALPVDAIAQGTGTWISAEFDATEARYVKVEITLPADGGNCAALLNEIEVYTAVPGIEPGDYVETPSWENCIYSGDTVTVPAGETVFFEIGTAGQIGTFDFEVLGEGAFDVAVATEGVAGGYADGYTAGTPAAAVDGKFTGSITSYESTYGYACFAITNNGDAEASYTVNLVFPEGTPENPEAITLEIGTEVEVTVPANGSWSLAATLPATDTNYELSVFGATGFGIKAGMSPMPQMDTEGLLAVIAQSSMFTGGAYNFTIINNTEEEQTYVLTLNEMPEYTMSLDALVVGTQEYSFDWNYAYTVFVLEPSEIGKYTISSEQPIGLVSTNGMWITVDSIADVVGEDDIVFECTSVGQSIWVAVPYTDENYGYGEITVSYEEITIVEIEDTVYENVVTPEKFEFDGDMDAIEYVDVEDDVVNNAVLGDDGFYHLDSADGPVLLVVLNDELMSLLDASSYGQLADILYDESGAAVEKVDYNTAFGEYAAAAYTDEASGMMLYPLTEDLITIIKNVSDEKGWFGENGFLGFTSEDAWMFLCCYDSTPADESTGVAGDVDGDGEITADDYIKLKRAFFGMVELDDEALARSDIYGDDGEITADDYILLKRVFFGMATLD